MQELRCPHCNRLLGKADLAPGSKVEISCRSRACLKRKKNIIQFGTKENESEVITEQ